MPTVGLAEAEAKLPVLLDRAERGEEVAIARDGRPVAKLVQVAAAPRRLLIGALKGQIRTAPDRDVPMSEEELAEWYGRARELGTSSTPMS